MEKQKAKKIAKRAGIVIIAAAVAGGGFFAWREYARKKRIEAFAAQMAANSYNVEDVKKDRLHEVVSATGVAALASSHEIVSESADKIKTMSFKEGDKVSAGAVAASYDAEETAQALQRKIADAEINLENARLSLRSLTLPASESELRKLSDAEAAARKTLNDRQAALASAENEIRLKQEDITEAEEDDKTAEELLSVGGMSEEERRKAADTLKALKNDLDKLLAQKDSAERDVTAAEAAVKSAEYELEKAGSVLSEESDKIKYEQQKNAVKSAELTIAQAKEDLQAVVYETKSPYSGTIMEVSAQEGQRVEKGKPLYTISNFDELIVTAEVSEYDAPKLQLGQAVSMTSDGIEGKVYTGKISYIAPKAEVSGSDTVNKIEVTLDNPDGVLKPGFNLDLEIIIADKPDVISVSQAAVMKDKEGGGQYVFTLGQGMTAVKTPVETGIYGDVNVEITSGLKEGDKIVSDPSDTIKEGDRIAVKVKGAGGAAAGASGAGGGMMFGGPGGGMQVRPAGGGNGGGRVRIGG
ncbi:MAG: efflux RND transporter periplasmic adaptor subunit [Clostridiales bacterium]|jgi:RND family efflux transporter MFP subunit|nr:efflux RND transporter periplasmic adaptor subunit [Clostridiales bacterium]